MAAAALSQLPPVNRQPIFAYVAVVLLIAGTAAVIPGYQFLRQFPSPSYRKAIRRRGTACGIFIARICGTHIRS